MFAALLDKLFPRKASPDTFAKLFEGRCARRGTGKN